jgi:hypothetical protein
MELTTETMMDAWREEMKARLEDVEAGQEQMIATQQ